MLTRHLFKTNSGHIRQSITFWKWRMMLITCDHYFYLPNQIICHGKGKIIGASHNKSSDSIFINFVLAFKLKVSVYAKVSLHISIVVLWYLFNNNMLFLFLEGWMCNKLFFQIHLGMLCCTRIPSVVDIFVVTVIFAFCSWISNLSKY